MSKHTLEMMRRNGPDIRMDGKLLSEQDMKNLESGKAPKPKKGIKGRIRNSKD